MSTTYPLEVAAGVGGYPDHGSVEDTVEAIRTALGVNPGGTTNVADRLARLFAVQDSIGVSIDEPRFAPPSSSTTPDSDKLDATLAYAKAQTFRPAVRIPDRLVALSRGFRRYDGIRLIGSGISSNAETANGRNLPNKVSCGFAGGVILEEDATVTSTANTSIKGLAFYGSGAKTTVWWPGVAGVNHHGVVIEDVTFQAFKGILGVRGGPSWTATYPMLRGWWDVANGFDTQFTIAGSDAFGLWMDGMLIDSGQVPPFQGCPHINLTFQSLTHMGPVYSTNDGDWSGLLVSGHDMPGNSGGCRELIITAGARFEGRNPDDPCKGSVVRIVHSSSGGVVSGPGPAVRMVNVWLSNAMLAPLASEQGVVHMTGGRLTLEGCAYQRATGVGEAVPFVYLDAGEVRVFNTHRLERGGQWIGGARIKVAGGVAAETRGASQAYAAGALLRTTQGVPGVQAVYRTFVADVGGTTATGAGPTMPEQVGASVVDGGVTWRLRSKVVVDDTAVAI